MGACCSRRRQQPSTTTEPNEQTSLLHSAEPHEAVEITQQNNSVIKQQREQETLKKIVKTTAENLIDISSIRLLDKIQPEHAVERAKEYSIISRMPELHTVPSAVAFSPVPISSISEVLSKPGAVREDDVRLTSDMLSQVRVALEEVKVNEVGEVVVPL
ncbi:hypothetical protein HDU67_007472 [Dinochytrium kinnereticum]|nr:hypothetical protein HDU67_007472 [Dinochytrium kinnereticum]